MAEALEKWAEEMGINSNLKQANKNAFTSANYRNLTKGQITNIWKFVIHHVKPVQEVKKIRLNLDLNDMSVNPSQVLITVERDMLDKEKESLKNRIANATAALQSDHRTTLLRTKEKNKSAEDIKELQRQSRDHQQSVCLLKEFVESANTLADKYSQKNNQIQHVLASRHKTLGTTKETATIYFTRDTGDHVKNPVLETASMRSVRESCEAIQNALLTHENVINNRPDSFFNKKRLLHYNNIVAMLETNSVCDVLNCLNELQQERMKALKTLLEKLDFENDAQNLQFQYLPRASNSNCLKDLQSCPDVFRDIKASVIGKFMELQKINMSIKTMSARYELIKEQLQLHLDKMFSAQPGNLQLARQLVECQLEKEFAQACSEDLDVFRSKLTEEVSRDRKSQQVKLSKYEDIKNMQTTIRKKQETIRTLFACNAEYNSKLEQKIQAIIKFIVTNIKHPSIECTEKPQTWQNFLSSEVEIFGSLPLSMLILARADGLVFLSPYLTISERMVDGQFITNLCKALGLIDNKPPEKLLPELTSLKRHAFQTQQMLKCQNGLLDKLLRSYSCVVEAECMFTSESLTDLKEKLQRNWRQRVLSCGLKQQHILLDNGFKACQELENVIDIWWELPAGNIILPLSLTGCAVKQYKDNLIAESV